MLLEYLRIAFKVLRSHKFRSFLTVLSITVGAFSIVLMSSLAESGLQTLRRGIEDLGGARLIDVGIKPPERAENKTASYSGGITVADWDLLAGALPHIVERTRFTGVGRRDAVGDSGVYVRSDVMGGDGGFIDLFRMKMAAGRQFTEDENRRHAKVCVVGDEVARRVWGGDAVGRWLAVSGVRCHVVGQLADQERWGINFGFDWRNVIVIPFETLRDVDPLARVGVECLFKTDDPLHNDVVKRIVNALLVARHHGVDDFEIFDFSRFMDKFDQMFAIMKAIVGFIAGIALLVGGIGVMNMMLVSVSERVREIGIRKALGASPSDIAAQFLCEAIVLSGAGGAIGVAGGVGAAILAGRVIVHFKPVWVSVVADGAVVAALAVSVGVGLVFGFFPARRAGRLDAIQAIRR